MTEDTALDTTIHPPSMTASEAEMLLFALDRSRAQFAWKCGGLDAAGLSKPHPPSAMTLGGLLKHVALVEDTHRCPRFDRAADRTAVGRGRRSARRVRPPRRPRGPLPGGRRRSGGRGPAAAMMMAMQPPIPAEQLTIVPANEASWDDLAAL